MTQFRFSGLIDGPFTCAVLSVPTLVSLFVCSLVDKVLLLILGLLSLSL